MEEEIEKSSVINKIHAELVIGNKKKLDELLLLIDKYSKEWNNDETVFFMLLTYKSDILRKLNNYIGAIEALDILLDKKPIDPESVIIQGLLYEKIGSIEKAIEKYNSAIEIYDSLIQQQPSDFILKLDRAKTYMYLDKDKAFTELDKLVVDSPNEEHFVSVYKQNIVAFNKENEIQAL